MLRKYDGANKPNQAPDIVPRTTCGYTSGINRVGTDPEKYTTEPFDDNVDKIGSYLDKLTCFNEYKLSCLDLVKTTNLTIGLYQSIIITVQ